MLKIYPHDERVANYVDYYWQLGSKEVDDIAHGRIHDFPCLTPELIADIEGEVPFFYKSQLHQLHPGTLFGYMDASVTVDLSNIKTFTVVRFKCMGPAANLPFLRCSATDLVRSHFVDVNQVFSQPISRQLQKALRSGTVGQKRDGLDRWLRQCFDRNRLGFLNELVEEIEPHHDVAEIARLSNLSLSSLERHFKKESGMTPKKFLMHNRFRLVLQDIARADVTDWQDIVYRYNYYDQAHMIKEVKRFSGLTPSELLRINKLSTLRQTS